jgi:hypothetical protein
MKLYWEYYIIILMSHYCNFYVYKFLYILEIYFKHFNLGSVIHRLTLFIYIPTKALIRIKLTLKLLRHGSALYTILKGFSEDGVRTSKHVGAIFNISFIPPISTFVDILINILIKMHGTNKKIYYTKLLVLYSFVV